jgi:acetyl esterase/lipase
LSSAAEPTEPTERDEFYAEGLVARIYAPDGPGRFPGLVEVHGGAWNGLSYRSDDALNRELARRGIFVASLEFRQGPEGAYPKSVRDVTAGIEWLAANRERFGLTRIGALGNSSGGQQVMLTALLPGEPGFTDVPAERAARLDFVVLCWPVIDPLARYEWARASGDRPQLAAKHRDYWGDAETMADGSPQHVVAGARHRHLPPALMIGGGDDANLPPGMLDAFARAYREAGGQIKAEIFEGQGHNFVIRDFASDAARRAVDVISDFILTERPAA